MNDKFIGPRPRSRPLRKLLKWACPSILMLLVPKCPACLAAYVLFWTGLGLSFSTAAYLRWSLVTIGILSIGYLVIRRVLRLRLTMTKGI